MKGFGRSVRLLVLVLAALAFTAVPAQAKSCNAYRLGAGYGTSLKTTGVGCATGKSVANAQAECRHEHGTKGKCTHKVKRYSCAEGKRSDNGTEFDALVTCKKGAKKVVFTYQQNYK